MEIVTVVGESERNECAMGVTSFGGGGREEKIFFSLSSKVPFSPVALVY